MPGGPPPSGSKVWEGPNRAISKSGKYRHRVVAHGDSQPTAAFHDRENRATFGPACGLPMCNHPADRAACGLL